MSSSSYAVQSKQETNYLFWRRFAQGKLKTHVSSVKVRIPSPKEILSWSERRLPNSTLVGKVDNAHTVEHDTLRPVSGGLFCERIFGPMATNVCACLRKKGWNEDFCKTCEVQFTKSRLRRYQMGHILLSAPVIHIWALQGGYLATLLGKKNFGIRSIAYGKVMCQAKPRNYLLSKNFHEALQSFPMRPQGRNTHTQGIAVLSKGDTYSFTEGDGSKYQAGNGLLVLRAPKVKGHFSPSLLQSKKELLDVSLLETGPALAPITLGEGMHSNTFGDGCCPSDARNYGVKVKPLTSKVKESIKREDIFYLNKAKKDLSFIFFKSSTSLQGKERSHSSNFLHASPEVVIFDERSKQSTKSGEEKRKNNEGDVLLAENLASSYSLYGKKYYEFQKQRHLEKRFIKNSKHLIYERGNLLPFYQFILYKPDTFKNISQFFDSSNRRKFTLPIANYSIQKIDLPFFYRKNFNTENNRNKKGGKEKNNSFLWKKSLYGFINTYFLHGHLSFSNVSILTNTAFVVATAEKYNNSNYSKTYSCLLSQEKKATIKSLISSYFTNYIPLAVLPSLAYGVVTSFPCKAKGSPLISKAILAKQRDAQQRVSHSANFVRGEKKHEISNSKRSLLYYTPKAGKLFKGCNTGSLIFGMRGHLANFLLPVSSSLVREATPSVREATPKVLRSTGKRQHEQPIYFSSNQPINNSVNEAAFQKTYRQLSQNNYVKNDGLCAESSDKTNKTLDYFSTKHGLYIDNLQFKVKDKFANSYFCLIPQEEIFDAQNLSVFNGLDGFNWATSYSGELQKQGVVNMLHFSNEGVCLKKKRLNQPKTGNNYDPCFAYQGSAFYKGSADATARSAVLTTRFFFPLGHKVSEAKSKNLFSLQSKRTRRNTFCVAKHLPLACNTLNAADVAPFGTGSFTFGDGCYPVRSKDAHKHGTQNKGKAQSVPSQRKEKKENFVKYGFTGPSVLFESLKNLNLILLEDLISWKWEQGKTRLDSFLLQNKLRKKKRGLRNKLAKTKIILTRRKKLIQSFLKTKQLPEWMVLSVLPVLPPALRPILELEPSNVVVSDLNVLYQTIIRRNDALMGLLSFRALEIDILSRQVSLQQAIEKLFDKGAGTKKRPLKSLSQGFHGKKGLFRLHLLGKRVDYSGRSVIVVGPQLKLHECGLPKEMALVLFLPFLIARLKKNKIAHNTSKAKQLIIRKDKQIWSELRALIYEHPVLLNRAPTLHRLGFQAFQPILVSGKAIILPALVCTGFNADFDGDQMAVHVPLSYTARAESWKLLYAKNNMLSPATGKSVIGLSQEMILGCYASSLLINKTHSLSALTSFAHMVKIQSLADSKRKDTDLLKKKLKSLISSYDAQSLVSRPSLALFATRFFFPLGHKVSEAKSKYLFPPKTRSNTFNANFVRGNIFDDGCCPSGTQLARKKPKEKGKRWAIKVINFKEKTYFTTFQEIHKALNQNKIALQTPIWLRLPLFEDNTSLEEPLEIRLNTIGHFFRLYGQSQRYFSKKIKSKSQLLGISYIRTSAGRVQLNETFYSSISK